MFFSAPPKKNSRTHASLTLSTKMINKASSFDYRLLVFLSHTNSYTKITYTHTCSSDLGIWEPYMEQHISFYTDLYLGKAPNRAKAIDHSERKVRLERLIEHSIPVERNPLKTIKACACFYFRPLSIITPLSRSPSCPLSRLTSKPLTFKLIISLSHSLDR